MRGGNLYKYGFEIDRKIRKLKHKRRYIEEHSEFISGLIYLGGGMFLTLFGIIIWRIL